MPEVKSVLVQVQAPNLERNDFGRVTTGYYTIEEGLITMTDGAGKPMLRFGTGEPITHKLAPGDKEEAQAQRLTGEVYRMVQGLSLTSSTGFNRRLEYRPLSIA